MWKAFLLIGTSLLSLVSTSCSSQREWIVRADYLFINESSTFIDIPGSSIQLNPGDSSWLMLEGEGPKHTDANSFGPPYESATILIDSTFCLYYESTGRKGLKDGFVLIENYEAREIDERYWEFTYRFRDEQFTNAEPCD